MFTKSGDSQERSGEPIDNSAASCIISPNARERQLQVRSAPAKEALPHELRRRNLQPDFSGNPKSESSHVQTDSVMVHRVWSETTRQLQTFHRDVRESKRVLEASVFGRWLRMSGILEILEANPQDFPLEVDGKALRRSVEDLLSDCGEKFRSGKADPTYAQSDIAEINRKLDVIASHVSKFSPPAIKTPESDVGTITPELRVIEGGAR